MPITILQPAPAAGYKPSDNDYASDSDSDSDSDGGVDVEGDVSMDRQPKRYRRSDYDSIVTPGEVITEDPQWMR